MSEDLERLANKLVYEGQKTVAFFSDLMPGQWEQVVYSDGSKWTIRLVLAHFVATESAFTQLIEDILANGKGAPEDFNIDEFNEQEVALLQKTPENELLHQFALRRKVNADQVRRMRPDDLQKTGRHPFLGDTSLEVIIKMLYLHIQTHLRDLRRLLTSGR